MEPNQKEAQKQALDQRKGLSDIAREIQNLIERTIFKKFDQVNSRIEGLKRQFQKEIRSIKTERAKQFAGIEKQIKQMRRNQEEMNQNLKMNYKSTSLKNNDEELLLKQNSMPKKKLNKIQNSFDKKKENQRGMKSRKKVHRSYQDQVYLRTTYLDRFKAEQDKVTLVDPNATGGLQQILIDKTINLYGKFTFTTKINSSMGGKLVIGIVDKKTQGDSISSYLSQNVICYEDQGIIHNLGLSTQKNKIITGVKLQPHMEVKIVVQIEKQSVSFTLKNSKGDQISCPPVKNKMLKEKCRQFVPYFQMSNAGESISWNISHDL